MRSLQPGDELDYNGVIYIVITALYQTHDGGYVYLAAKGEDKLPCPVYLLKTLPVITPLGEGN